MRFLRDYERRRDVSREMATFVGKRIGFIFQTMRDYPENSLRAALVSAYLQGMEDAADAISRANSEAKP